MTCMIWPLPASFSFGVYPLCCSLTGLSSNHQIEGECDNHCVMWKPTNPPMDPSFCTLEIPVFTLCLASNLFLPHPPTAKISTNVTSSKAFLVPIVTLITTFCLSVSGINKLCILECLQFNRKKKKKEEAVFVINLLQNWFVCRLISPALNQHSAESSDIFKAASWHKKF